MTETRIDTVCKRETAEKIIAKLRKITAGDYHNFVYCYGAQGGMFGIFVKSDYEYDANDDDPKEHLFRDFVYSAFISKL